MSEEMAKYEVKKKKMTRDRLIIAVISYGEFLAIHEVAARIKARGYYYSENGIGDGVRKLTRKGMLVNQKREGKPFKEWRLHGSAAVVFKDV